jgi:hypothetical protein
MKSISLWSFAFAGLASAAAIPDGPTGHAHGSAPAAPAKGTKVEEIKSLFGAKNKRVRVTYGTYNLAAFNAPPAHGGMGGMDMGGMAHEGGMKDASADKAPKPCSDCTLKYAKASLTYPDGSIANIDSGTWLHHLTMSVVGPGRVDLACPGGTKRIPKDWERMLAIHNDRNETFFGNTATDEMGFYLGDSDSMNLELMLKNEINTPKDVVFNIEWEFVPGKQPGWGEVHGIWMDAAPCSAMMSDIDPPSEKTQFTLTGPSWTSTIDGKLLNTVGHMHDGGLEVQILRNKAAVCTSKASYDAAGYVPSEKTIKDGATKMSHISSYSPCIAIGEIKKGDQLTLSASYDFNKYKAALNKVGKVSHVMGVAMVFVEFKQK